MDLINIDKLLSTNNEFEYNGYVVTRLNKEDVNKEYEDYYNPLKVYRVYNRYSAQGDYQVFEQKDELISYLLKENRYEAYYNRLDELGKPLDFDYSYDFYSYLIDWIDNYFGYERVDFQIKYNNGKLSKKCKNSYIYIY